MHDFLNQKGRVLLTHTKADGSVVQHEVSNLVVLAGRAWIASRMEGASSAVMSHLAVGSSSTAPAAGDTALGSEVARVALISAVAASNTITYIAQFPAGTGTGALEEAGIFNDGTTGTMLARVTFPVINKGSGDTLQVSWTIENGV